MVDAVEAFRNISIQNVLRTLLDTLEDRFHRIMTGASRSESIAVRLELGFPFGFQRELDQRLQCSVREGWNAERPLFVGSGFGNPDSTGGLRLDIQIQGGYQDESFLGFEGCYAVYAGGFLTLVVL
ncbi:MAG TPA: hypothetical protein VG013_40115, partial [Gemmataceae bacterium]|nr:hypothetical protein [Gemmataceae bacterium]